MKALITKWLIIFNQFFSYAQIPVIEIPKIHSLNTSLPKIGVTATQITTPSEPFFPNYLGLTSRQDIDKRNLAAIKQDIRDYENRGERDRQIINEARKVFPSPEDHVQYFLTSRNIPGKSHFNSALQELDSMLSNKKPQDLIRAIYLSENAFSGNEMNYHQFRKELEDRANLIKMKFKELGYDKNDNLAKNLLLFQYMSDTLKVHPPGLEKPIVTLPKLYDFEDFWGRYDYSKMFLSKLMATGTGNCHSLPLLYLALAELTGTEASLAFAPNHSYIKFQGPFGDWYNIELTNQMLTSDAFILQSGYIKSEALKSGIYMNPVSNKELIVQCVNDLALSWIKKYGVSDELTAMTNLALKHSPKSLTAHQINANYYTKRWNKILGQYRRYGFTEKHLIADEKANHVYSQMTGVHRTIDDLGFSFMPQDAYEKWLGSCQEEAQRTKHTTQLRQMQGRIKK